MNKRTFNLSWISATVLVLGAACGDAGQDTTSNTNGLASTTASTSTPGVTPAPGGALTPGATPVTPPGATPVTPPGGTPGTPPGTTPGTPPGATPVTPPGGTPVTPSTPVTPPGSTPVTPPGSTPTPPSSTTTPVTPIPPSTTPPVTPVLPPGTTPTTPPTPTTEPTTSETGGETTTSVGDGTILLTEDFEDDAAGAAPEGYDTFIAWNANPTNPSASEVVAVGNGQKHGGSQALQVKGGSNPAQLVWKIPTGQNKLYVRSWIYLADRQLGQNPDANHETLIALRDSVGQANSEIRFGEIKGIIGTNEVPTDDISPKQDQWGKGPVIAKGKWVCLEVAFLGDLPYHEIHAWADGELVHEVTAADQWNNSSLKSPTWMQGRFVELVFGWHSFSSASNTVWFDDIVVSTAPVGCQ